MQNKLSGILKERSNLKKDPIKDIRSLEENFQVGKHPGFINRPPNDFKFDSSISFKHGVKRNFVKISKIIKTVNVLLIEKVKELNSP